MCAHLDQHKRGPSSAFVGLSQGNPSPERAMCTPAALFPFGYRFSRRMIADMKEQLIKLRDTVRAGTITHKGIEATLSDMIQKLGYEEQKAAKGGQKPAAVGANPET